MHAASIAPVNPHQRLMDRYEGHAFHTSGELALEAGKYISRRVSADDVRAILEPLEVHAPYDRHDLLHVLLALRWHPKPRRSIVTKLNQLADKERATLCVERGGSPLLTFGRLVADRWLAAGRVVGAVANRGRGRRLPRRLHLQRLVYERLWTGDRITQRDVREGQRRRPRLKEKLVMAALLDVAGEMQPPRSMEKLVRAAYIKAGRPSCYEAFRRAAYRIDRAERYRLRFAPDFVPSFKEIISKIVSRRETEGPGWWIEVDVSPRDSIVSCQIFDLHRTGSTSS